MVGPFAVGPQYLLQSEILEIEIYDPRATAALNRLLKQKKMQYLIHAGVNYMEVSISVIIMVLIYFKKSGMNRNWINIRLNKSCDKIYCWIGLAFCKEKHLPSLASGTDIALMSLKHLYYTLE